MAVSVPAQYQSMVNNAAQQLGIPPAVVAAQIQIESGWNPNALSPTGAQGIAQFEPGTWATYGQGSPNDPTAAFAAYVKFMSVLLQQFGGNVTNALAAYNAGAGNIQAGMGYAHNILSLAGTGTVTSTGVTGGGGTAGGGAGAAAPAVSTPQTGQTASTGPGTTCAWALGNTNQKVLIWTFNFSICIVSKTELRALIGAMMVAGGAVITLVGAALVLQYGLDKTGAGTAVMGAIPGIGGKGKSAGSYVSARGAVKPRPANGSMPSDMKVN